ncbi:MAG: filamentous hemagglutinin N-terminal domain-containing protein [Cyanobacteria bacterium J06633_8]
MLKKSIHFGWLLKLALVSIGIFWVNSADAQIIPDSTLLNNSTVKKQGNRNIIEGGSTAGSNLFHSFQEFGVVSGGEAYFNNSVEINNIITRVTGSSISNINGLIKANGTANLFIINPNGIAFGENAKLDIGGSFIGTTADSIKFPDDIEFSAKNPQNKPLLTVNVPLGLQYGKNHRNISSNISNSGSLTVGEGKNITLIGNSFENLGNLKTKGGQISIAAISPQGFASLGNSGEILGLDGNTNSIGKVINLGKIDASNLQGVGGKVTVFGDRIGLLENSFFDASGTVGGGEIIIGNSDTKAVYIDSEALLQSNALNRGDGGNISVFASESTRVYGSFSAKGGINNGNGGKVETSGNNFLDITGTTVDTNANNGLNGDWLLNSGNIFFGSTSSVDSTADKNDLAIFQPLNNTTLLDSSTIEKQLSAGNNLAITARKTANQNGNIQADKVNIITNNNTPVTLTFAADNDIALSEGNIISALDKTGLIFQADRDADGKGKLSIGKNSEEISVVLQTTGGEFNASASGDILVSNTAILSTNKAANNSESMAIATKGSLILQKSFVVKDKSGAGNNGEINIEAANSVLRETSSISNKVNDISDGGDINIKGNRLSLEDDSTISNDTYGNGNAGKINIQLNSLSVKSGAISSVTEGNGNSGLIKIETDIFDLNEGPIQSTTLGNGDAGDIIFNTKSFSLAGGALSTKTEAKGNAGDIEVNAIDKILISNAGALTSDSNGEGDAGNINLNTNSLVLNQGVIASNANAYDNNFTSPANAGDINIKADSVSLQNRSTISSTTQGNGNGGLIKIETNIFDLNQGPIQSTTLGSGNAGNIIVNTKLFSLTNGAFITKTEAKGDAGDININAIDEIFIGNKGALTSDSNGEGNAGSINLNTNSLILRNLGVIASKANAYDNNFSSLAIAGNINIEANDILLDNNSVITSNTSVTGNAGEIKLKANNITLKRFSNIIALSEENSTGKAGKITLTARDILFENDAKLVEDNPDKANSLIGITKGKGNAGEINITAEKVILRNQGAIETSTRGEGNAGRLTLNTSLLQVENSRLQNRGGITSGSVGSGKAGELVINADKILVNNSDIEAETKSGNGGDININLKDVLILRNGSSITTNAGTQQLGGDGGNINIDAKFIVALPEEDSNITANAFSGKGGMVNIKSNGIFGIFPQNRPTKFSDITASSELGVSGEININRTAIDPAKGLIELPTSLVDASQEIVRDCNSEPTETASSFISTGRGGLPLNPYEPLTEFETIANWVTLTNQNNQQTRKIKLETPKKSTSRQKIVEAQGWIENSRGEIEFVAQLPKVYSSNVSQQSNCDVMQ